MAGAEGRGKRTGGGGGGGGVAVQRWSYTHRWDNISRSHRIRNSPVHSLQTARHTEIRKEPFNGEILCFRMDQLYISILQPYAYLRTPPSYTGINRLHVSAAHRCSPSTPARMDEVLKDVNDGTCRLEIHLVRQGHDKEQSHVPYLPAVTG